MPQMDEHDNKTGSQKQGGWTPGQWTFANGSMTGAVWAEKEFIASVFPNAPEGWDGFSEYPQVQEMRANARLIAAAPELYEALQAVLDTSGARGTYDSLEYSKAVALAENALIKARANPSTAQDADQ